MATTTLHAMQMLCRTELQPLAGVDSGDADASVRRTPPEEAAMSAGDSTDQGKQLQNFTNDPITGPGGEAWEGNPHANGAASWLIHTPDSWARSLLGETLRWMGPETVAIEAPLLLRARRLDDDSIRVHVTWTGTAEPPHRITLQP
jgi:hypothetical protein